MAGCILPGTPVHQIKRCPQHYAVSIDSCTNVTQPTGALDYNTSKEILKLIETVNQKYGNTIVMVTHNDAIKDMADRVVKLRDGMIRKNYINEHKIPAAELDW